MTEPKPHAYESTTLGLPPLKMVLVHARNEVQNAAAAPRMSPVELLPAEDALAEKERVIRRLIERLEELD
jgi:hypothetical protein